jgi:hypothetical protein
MSLDLIDSVSEVLLMNKSLDDREIDLLKTFLGSLEDDHAASLESLRPRHVPSRLPVP